MIADKFLNLFEQVWGQEMAWWWYVDRGAVGKKCFHLEIATLHLQAGRNLLSGRSSIFIIQGFLRATFFKLQIKGMKLTQVGRYSCRTKPGLEEASVILYIDDPVNLAVHTGRKKVPQVECYHLFRPCNFNSVTGTGESKGGCVNHPSLSTHPPKWNKRPFTHFSITSPPHYRGKSHPGAQISQQSFTRGKTRGWSTCKTFQNLKAQDGTGKVREIHDSRNLPDGFSFDPAQGFKLDDPQHEVSQSATLQPINHQLTIFGQIIQQIFNNFHPGSFWPL